MSSPRISSAQGDAAAVTFTVAAAAIPAGVRCGACRRLHLPHRLHPVTAPGDLHGAEDSKVLVRCSRCGSVGELVTDPSDPQEVAIREAITTNGARGGADHGAGW